MIIFIFTVFVLFVIAAYSAFSCIKAQKEVKFYRTVPPVDSGDENYRSYYALRDEVSHEMLFSPFYAKNSACAIRQVQEVIKNPQLFPKSLHAEDVALYYVFSINDKSLHVSEPSEINYSDMMKLSMCDEDSLKLAYEKFKEVK